MREATKQSPIDQGIAEVLGRCQVCGAEGRVLAVPEAPPPNEFCERCAIEYGEAVEEDEEEGP